MRDRIRTLVHFAGISFEAAPRQAWTLVASLVLAQVATLGATWGLKLVVDAALRGDVRAAVVAGVIAALVERAGFMLARHGMYVAREVEDRASLLVDRRLMTLVAGIPGIEHHERPEFSDRIEMLREQRRLLAGLTSALVYNVTNAVQMVGAAILLSTVSPWLLGFFPLAAVSVITARKANSIRERAWERTAERTRLRRSLFDIATSATAGKELRIFGVSDEVASRHRAVARDASRQRARAAWKSQVVELAGTLSMAAAFTGAVGLTLDRAIGGSATAGDVLLAARLAAEMHFMIAAIAGSASRVFEAISAARRYLWLVDYAAPRLALEAIRPVPARLERGITLEAVSFAYPGTSMPVLTDVSLTFPAGCVVAIVGENGAGKTTLLKLLCRFYDANRGRILVDGIDLRAIDHTEWRRNLTAGFQDFCRFEFTAGETVGVGDLPKIAEASRVKAAISRADAGDVIAALPAGLGTQLGNTWNGGVELSGGQWQKLALARGLMRPTPLLTIFDEPTATLDAETEHALFSRLAGAARARDRFGGVTVIISHRFSTVRAADLIVVLDHGRVVESDSHAELIRRDGAYARLFRLQARGYA